MRKYYKSVEISRYKQIMDKRRKTAYNVNDAFDKDAVDRRISKTLMLGLQDVDKYGIFHPCKVDSNCTVNIPKEAVAVEDTLMKDVRSAVVSSGIQTKTVTLTGGENIKYLAYSEETQKDEGIVAFTRPLCKIKVIVQPENISILDMIVRAADNNTEVLPALDTCICIKDSILNKEMITYICLNAAALASSRIQLEYSGTRMAKVFNGSLIKALKEYECMTAETGKVRERDVISDKSREKIRGSIIKSIEELGYSIEVRENSKFNRKTVQQKDFEGVPDLIFNALNSSCIPTDGIDAAYEPEWDAKWMEGILGKSGTSTYLRILKRLSEAVTVTFYISGVIDVSINGKGRTRYVLAVDSRNRYRLANINRYADIIGMSTVLDWEYLDEVKKIHRKGNSSFLMRDRIEDEDLYDSLKFC